MLKLPTGQLTWEAGPTLGSSLLPAGSGGLLPTLYLWRRLALEGIEHFGQVEYLGTAPLPGYDGLADVLVGTYKGVECWFYFDPARGDLLALEMYPAENADPCEVYFSDYHDVDGRCCRGGWKSAPPTVLSASSSWTVHLRQERERTQEREKERRKTDEKNEKK